MPATDGLWIWIWNWQNCEGGNAATIAAKLKSVGAKGAIVKVADGDHWFEQGQPATAIVAALRAAGTDAATWQYCYGKNATAEMTLGVQTIQQCAPAFHVLDVEQEFEDYSNAATVATALASGIKADIAEGFPLCYSPLPAIRYHLRLPYRQFTDAGLLMLPQLYWTGLQWTEQQTREWFYVDAAQYGLTGQPIAPAYQDSAGCRPTEDDLRSFLAGILAAGATGCSVWSYEHLDAGGWARAALAALLLRSAAVVTQQPPATPATPLTNDDRVQIVRYLWTDPPQISEAIRYLTGHL